MLRVGLTGGLGSGKSTVAGYLRESGAEVIESDELGRALMEPGQPVYAEILRVFGPEVAGPDGRLNRARLAELAFGGGRLQTLNALIHPAVIDAQQQWMENVFSRDRTAVAVIVSALIFEVERDALASGVTDSVIADWRRRIDRVVVVTAPDETKIARYAARLSPDGVGSEAIQADARSRLAHQIPDATKAARADYVIENTGDLSSLRSKVQELWASLKAESNKLPTSESLK
jgi:dephospho-CoA kinase